jgi:DNA-binding MltR family transcriptional regulator
MIRNIDGKYSAPTLEQVKRMGEAVKGESDRGLVLINATILDELLKQYLLAHLVEHKDIEKLFNGVSAPLGTFSARILFSFAVGLLPEDEYRELNLIRNIRNEFAHSVEVSFRTPSVVSRCQSLMHSGKIVGEPLFGPREMFALSAAFMTILIESRLIEASNQRLSYREWNAKPNSSVEPSR